MKNNSGEKRMVLDNKVAGDRISLRNQQSETHLWCPTSPGIFLGRYRWDDGYIEISTVYRTQYYGRFDGEWELEIWYQNTPANARYCPKSFGHELFQNSHTVLRELLLLPEIPNSVTPNVSRGHEETIWNPMILLYGDYMKFSAYIFNRMPFSFPFREIFEEHQNSDINQTWIVIAVHQLNNIAPGCSPTRRWFCCPYLRQGARSSFWPEVYIALSKYHIIPNSEFSCCQPALGAE